MNTTAETTAAAQVTGDGEVNQVSETIEDAMHEPGPEELLKKHGIEKKARNSGGCLNAIRRTPMYLIPVLLLIPLSGMPNLCRYLRTERGMEHQVSKGACCTLLSNAGHDRRSLLMSVARRIIVILIKDNCRHGQLPPCPVADDSVIPRERSRAAELPAGIFDHTTGRTVKGFDLPVIGRTGGTAFFMVAFSMMSAVRETGRCNGPDESIDHDTPGRKAGMDAVMSGPDLTLRMLGDIPDADIPARYLLCDTWFTAPVFIKKVREPGPDLIGMVRDGTTRYLYQGKRYTLREPAQFVDFRGAGDLSGPLSVVTCHGTRVIFVRNGNKKSEYIVILSTDLTLTDAQAVALCGLRRSIEVCFRCCRSCLLPESGNQGRSCDRTVGCTAVALLRFSLSEYIRCRHRPDVTCPMLFFGLMDDLLHQREDGLRFALNGPARMFTTTPDDVSVQATETRPDRAEVATLIPVRMLNGITGWADTIPESVRDSPAGFIAQIDRTAGAPAAVLSG